MGGRAITDELLNRCRRDLLLNPYKDVVRNSIIKNGIENTAFNNQSALDMNYPFSVELETGKITNQDKSGRCWMFAALNTFRHKVSQEINVKDFELSQNYPLFWDKFEKANYFLENIIETRKESLDSRIVMWLMSNPVQDGGQWDMFSALVEKYGIVPKNIMPETFHSSNTRTMNRLLTLKLRESAKKLRDMGEKNDDDVKLRQEKERILGKFYDLLVTFLGQPPETFDFEYRDDDKIYRFDRGLTPLTFYKKYVNIDPDDYISIINAPTNDKPFLKTYTVQYLGNVLGGRPVKYLNVDMETLKALSLKQLSANEPVWFGCDVGQMMDRENGILDTELYLYEDALGTTFRLDKAGRLDYGESLLTHAMVFTGVHLSEEGNPVRWKVENSWSDKSGKEGYFIMSDSWFNEYTYQVVIHRKHLTPELLAAHEQPPVILNPWDPMGSLALMKGQIENET